MCCRRPPSSLGNAAVSVYGAKGGDTCSVLLHCKTAVRQRYNAIGNDLGSGSHDLVLTIDIDLENHWKQNYLALIFMITKYRVILTICAP